MSKALPASGEILFRGVTLNEFSAAYDLSAAQGDGVSAVILRATAGADYVDAGLAATAQSARENNLRLGFYHYLTAEDEDAARAQARFFANTISGYGASLRPSMRFDSLNGLSFDAANRIASAFLAEVQAATGVTPAIYTDAESASLLWNKNIADNYPLWVIDESGGDAPQLANSLWKSWIGWQYASLDSQNCAGGGAPIGGSDQGERLAARTDQRSPQPRSCHAACMAVGQPTSHFTADMLAQQIVVPQPPATKPESARKLICVTVRLGDTLSAIAALFGTSVDEIVKLNRIHNPNLIYPGQRLYLRVAKSVPYPCCDTYTVVRGDTLSGIGARFGVSWRHLATINEIPNPDRISIGQQIKLGLCAGK